MDGGKYKAGATRKSGGQPFQGLESALLTKAQTGHVLQVYKGHNGPVTCLVLHDFVDSNGKEKLLLITGSWDKVNGTGSAMHTD